MNSICMPSRRPLYHPFTIFQYKAVLTICLFFAGFLHLTAQELTPRRWAHLPIDTNVAGVAYVYTSADIYLDPLLQVEDLELSLNTISMKYVRSFEAFGKTARFELGQGYQEGTWKGLLEGTPAQTHRSGLTDTSLRISTVLYGAPPLKGKEFQQYRQSVANCETLIGAGLILKLPTGDYSNEKLINLGDNRFTLRPQLGVVHQRGHWTFEASGAIWLYADNNDFWQGSQREQDAFYAIQSHIIYTFRPGFWLSGSLGYGYGGENKIDGVSKNDVKANLAWAFAGGYSISRNMGFKVAYIGTQTQKDTSFDSNSIAVGFSVVW